MSIQNGEFPRLVSSAAGNKVFTCAGHADHIPEKLQPYEKKVELIACVDNVKVSTYRNVLSASSDYFMAMFRSPLQRTDLDTIELKEIDGATLKFIIDFMYIGSIELNSETVEGILRAADFLQIRCLVAACCGFIKQQLDTSNCLGITLFAEHHNYTELHKEALSFVLSNFDRITTEEEFLQLNKAQLEKLISSDYLATHSEEKVFQTLVTWFEYDKENREKFMFSLLSHIRFPLLSPEFIIENRHSVYDTMVCYELVRSWLQWHFSPEIRSQFPTASTRTRKKFKRLAILCGANSKCFNIKTLNRDLNAWFDEEITSAPKQECWHNIILINNKLISIGSRIRFEFKNTIEYLDPETENWTDLPPMLCERTCHGIAESNRNLYVIGGLNEDWLCSVEKYNFSAQEWQDMAPTISVFREIKVAGDEKHLYATGACSEVIECYDFAANKWTQIVNKNEKLLNFGIAVVDGYLYAIGGSKEGNPSVIVERYNPSAGSWTYVSPLKVGRTSVTCTVVNNRIIVFGGLYSNNLSFIEEYDSRTNEWSTLNTPLIENKCDFITAFSM